MSAITNLPEHRAQHRVLLAEDSSVIQDLLQLVLTQRGHIVDIVPDGPSALAALTSTHYDVALIDFHLPEMNGLQVVFQYLEQASILRPYFVAITGDVKGLLADRANCERFDKVLPKPLDVDSVCDLVGSCGAVELGRYESEVESRAQQNGTLKLVHARSPLEELDFTYLHWPLRDSALSDQVMDECDAILVHEAVDLNQLWRLKGAHLLPVMDLSGDLFGRADLNASELHLSDIESVGTLIEAFHERRKQVHRDLVTTSELSEKLLSRIYVSGGTLQPHHEATERSFIAYNCILDPSVISREIQALHARDLIDLEMFDRLHICGNCSSSRLNVREECPSCRSPDLTEKSYIHHFRCAYQGPETDFIDGDDLTCPKCRRTLNHFGHDYDRPGLMLTCDSCSQTMSEPDVGFICMDCGTKANGEAMATKDVHSAQMSDLGLKFMRAGPMFMGAGQRTLRFADLPLDLVVHLNQAARDYNENGTAFSLSYLGYNFELENEVGSRMFSQGRTLYLEALRQELPEEAFVVKGSTYDFVLISGVTPEEADRLLNAADRRAAQMIRFDLEAQYQHFGPSDIAS
ncbi:MAG: response regulator [Pseudomonadota bacterium]